jgi:hypothetical protein
MTSILKPAAASAAALLAAFLACGCRGVASVTAPAATTARAAVATTAPPKAAPKPSADGSAACYKRPDVPAASGGIFVRMLVPTLGWQAQELGGGWLWNVTARKCMTSAQMIIAGAPTEAGNCTQVAYASSNPGYDPDATPARPLRKIIAQAGPGC